MTRRTVWTTWLCSLLIVVAFPAGASAQRTFTGTNNIGVPEELMAKAQLGLEYIYQRDYAKAIDAFDEIDRDFPTSPVGAVGRSVIWQARMLEHYDFRFENEYYKEQKLAIERLDRVKNDSNLKAWNLFLTGGIVGLEGVQLARKGELLRALNKGWDALSAMKKAKRTNRDFHDPDLGLGLYNYWRSAYTASVPYLPFFSDRREEGIAQMINARDNGLLVWVGAGLALVYTWIEERNLDKANAQMDVLLAEYPQSVIGLMMKGKILKSQKKFKEAVNVFAKVRRIDSTNYYAVLWTGEAWYASRKNNADAERAYNDFLKNARHATDQQRALAEYRLGQLARRYDYLDEAIAHYKAAIALNPDLKGAQDRITEMEERKAKGLGKTRPEPRQAPSGPTPPIPGSIQKEVIPKER